jgi:hypothetical protein
VAINWASALTGAGGLAGGSTSASFGPVSAGPVSVNVAGFGGRASGSAVGAAVPSRDEIPQAMQPFMLPDWWPLAAAGVGALAILWAWRAK